MFKSGSMLAVVMAGSLIAASQASAAVSLTTSGSNYIGLINDGIPSSLADERTYINTLIAQPLSSGPTLVGSEAYTRSGNSCGSLLTCPDAILTDAVKDDSENNTFDLGDGGWTYILGKYDARQAGSLVWYVGDLTGVVSIPTSFGTCGSGGCGLSHLSAFKSDGGDDDEDDDDEIPEPATLALVGLSLVGLAASRRRKRA